MRLQRYRSTDCLNKRLQDFFLRLELAYVRDVSGKKVEVGTNYLMQQGVKGLLLMTVCAVCGMRQAVAMDTRCSPGLSNDGVESRPRRPCPDSTALCAGDSKVFDCIEEVRLLR